MWRVVTDLALMGFDEKSREMRVLALHPGVTPEQVQDATGFDLHIDKRIERTAPPHADELAVLRDLDPAPSLHGLTRPHRPPERTRWQKTEFGVAMRNFTRYPEMPSAQELMDYAVRVEKLGYESIWAWDHILLGVEPSFPIIESLSILTAIAARTQTIKLGIGVLVMPMRNPVILAKELGRWI